MSKEAKPALHLIRKKCDISQILICTEFLRNEMSLIINIYYLFHMYTFKNSNQNTMRMLRIKNPNAKKTITKKKHNGINQNIQE